MDSMRASEATLDLWARLTSFKFADFSSPKFALSRIMRPIVEIRASSGAVSVCHSLLG